MSDDVGLVRLPAHVSLSRERLAVLTDLAHRNEAARAWRQPPAGSVRPAGRSCCRWASRTWASGPAWSSPPASARWDSPSP